MQTHPILCFGGNGHATVRFDPARREAQRLGVPVEIRDVQYPGFEGRPRAETRQAFLESVLDSAEAEGPRSLVHASGIGALIALSVRAWGGLLDTPLVLQGPVLWGLESRRFPRLMRLPGAARALQALIAYPAVQRRFVRKHFLHQPEATFAQAFFQGYADCEAFADLFDYFKPATLRRLERELRVRPAALDGIEVWIGSRDEVVGRLEVDATERALGVRLPARVLPGWGHYPMIDEPAAWLREVHGVLAVASRAA